MTCNKPALIISKSFLLNILVVHVSVQLAGKVEPKEIQPGVGVAMVSGLLVASDNQYTLQVINTYLLLLVSLTHYGTCAIYLLFTSV